MEEKYIISSISELDMVIKSIMDKLTHNLILLEGEMGSGKTTFVKYFIKALTGYQGVTSPTFSIINEYQNSEGKPIYHMDLYRLETIDEALNIGIEEYLDADNLCLIEWPSLIAQILPQNHHLIKLELADNGDRVLIINNL